MKPLLHRFCLLVVFTSLFGMAARLPAQNNDNAWSVAILDRALADVPPGQGVAQVGDMAISVTTLKLWRDQLAGVPLPRFAIGTNVTLWPGGNVYYVFSNNVSPLKQQAFTNAALEWTLFANVHFIPRTTQANYTLISENATLGGGVSTVGMFGAPPNQFIQIGPNAWNRRTLVHEMGHTLGLVHEHQRSDRNSFITIISNNITPGQEGNFTLLTTSQNHGTYDFLSIMHYAHYAFSTNTATSDTMVPLPAYSQFYNLMGQADPVLSLTDRTNIAAIYGAPLVAAGPVVTNTQDNGPGSLRAAIYYGFDHPGTTVTFNIPTNDAGFASNVFTIQPWDQLPGLYNATIIDGSTEPFQLNPGGPAIQVNGALTGPLSIFTDGIVFRATNCAVRSLIINAFTSNGVRFDGVNVVSNTLSGCYVGINPAGSAAVPNSLYGVFLANGARGNVVGGTTLAARNVISGSTSHGVFITGSGTVKNVVEGNYIGLNGAGTAALPNAGLGVGFFNGAQSNLLGGTAAGAGNVISGNGSQGVYLSDAGTSGNVVAGNFIGLGPAGTNALPNNGAGVAFFSGASSNVIGGTAAGAGNVISGNVNQGVYLSDPGTIGNVVAGNYIGLDVTGSNAVPNTWAGISFFNGASFNLIGGTAAGAGNVISGNDQQGISIFNANTTGNVIAGNYIGLDRTGGTAISNTWSGIEIGGGVQSTLIGGPLPAMRNVISGNGIQGIFLHDAATSFNLVEGNYLGLNAAGTAAVPNNGPGVEIDGANANVIGGGTGLRNVISGNAAYGVQIDTGSVGNLVQGNTVGLTAAGVAAPNLFGGVVVFAGSQSNQIGGVTPGAANLIAGNVSFGVFVSGSTSSNNSVRGNSLFNNGSFGLAVQSGGNNSQVAPAIASAAVTTNTTIIGSLSGTAASTVFHIDFYASPPPSSSAEATVYVGSKDVTTSGAGSVSFTNVASVIPIGQFIKATATDPFGNTSQLSGAMAVTGTDSVGDGIPDAWRAAMFGGSGTTTNSTNCATCDPDHDGMNNRQEFLAGTNPTNAASVLKVGTVATSGTNVTVSFQSVAGITYRVESRDDLLIGGWSLLGDQLLGTGGVMLLTDPGAASLSKRFYRVDVDH